MNRSLLNWLLQPPYIQQFWFLGLMTMLIQSCCRYWCKSYNQGHLMAPSVTFIEGSGVSYAKWAQWLRWAQSGQNLTVLFVGVPAMTDPNVNWTHSQVSPLRGFHYDVTVGTTLWLEGGRLCHRTALPIRMPLRSLEKAVQQELRAHPF